MAISAEKRDGIVSASERMGELVGRVYVTACEAGDESVAASIEEMLEGMVESLDRALGALKMVAA